MLTCNIISVKPSWFPFPPYCGIIDFSWFYFLKLNVGYLNPPQYFIHCACIHTLSLSRVWLFETLWTVAHQASLSIGFSRQECWSGLPLPTPWDLSNPGIEPTSPTLTGGFFFFLTTELPGKSVVLYNCNYLSGKQTAIYVHSLISQWIFPNIKSARIRCRECTNLEQYTS